MAFMLDGWVPTNASSGYQLMTSTGLVPQDSLLRSGHLDP